jgi:hypothetical protein
MARITQWRSGGAEKAAWRRWRMAARRRESVSRKAAWRRWQRGGNK